VAHEQEKVDSVFDFLYVDRARLGSLLAQLSDDGVVTTAKRTSSHSGTNNGKVMITAAVVTADGSVTDTASEGLERSFDASWLLPINALTVLQESGMLHEGLVAPLGSLVHVKGRISIRDLELTRRLWEPLTKAMISSFPPNQQKEQRGQIDVAGKIINQMPPSTHLFMDTDQGDEVWGLLVENDPIFSTHALGLKFGSTVQGEWHVIAIMDAQPDDDDQPQVGASGLLSMLAPVIDEFRNLMGRPKTAYGITPLAVFRPCRAIELDDV